MHDGMPYGRNQGQGQGHSREVDRQYPTGLILISLRHRLKLFHFHMWLLSFWCPPSRVHLSEGELIQGSSWVRVRLTDEPSDKWTLGQLTMKHHCGCCHSLLIEGVAIFTNSLSFIFVYLYIFVIFGFQFLYI